MRDFTPEEKELIVNTPITIDCFEMDDFEGNDNLVDYWEDVIGHLEGIRKVYNERKDERYFIELVRLLPNSYKVVKL